MKLFHIGPWERCVHAPRSTAKLLKAMRLTAILLTLFSLHVAGHTTAQINYQGKDVAIKKVLDIVRVQGGIYMAYNEGDLEQAKPVTVTFNNSSVKDALDQIFKNQPLTYSIVNKTVFVIKKTPAASITLGGTLLPPIMVKGRVVDEDGDAVAGVTVKIKGTDIMTATSSDGDFQLEINDANSTIELSAVNIVPVEESLRGRTFIIFKVKSKTGILDQIQVIAYGTTSQRFNTGNVFSVKAKDIEKQTVTNPLLALQGRVPGLVVTQNSGIAGGGITVRIQGQNSYRSGNDPLYVIDGVPFNSQMPATTSGSFILVGSDKAAATGGGNGNPLNYINPSDIESITVLKDADATAIYGSRAANGAILIVTKKGKPGRTKIDVNAQQAWGWVGHKMDLLNTQQYLAMRREALKNSNSTPGSADYDLNGVWDTTRSTDWQKELIGHTSNYNKLSATFSGGNSNISYLLSGTYKRETTVFPGSFSDKVAGVHLNINSTSLDGKFKIQFSANYLNDLNHLPSVDLTNKAITLPPNAPKLKNEDGSLNWAPNSLGRTTWPIGQHPIGDLYRPYENITNNLVSNVVFSYEFIKGLEAKVSMGYNKLTTDETIVNTPSTYFPPERQPSLVRSSGFSNSQSNSWIIEPQISYLLNRSFGNINVLLGSTFTQNKTLGTLFNASGFSSDDVMKDIRSAPNVEVYNSINETYRYNALFGRISYNYKDKYLLNLSARRDGSTRFGPENRYQVFSAVGAGWIFSQEAFFREKLKFISFGKIKGSFGTTGNDQIGNYQFLNLYSPLTDGRPYQNVLSILPTAHTNPYLQWESTKKLQAGLELGFLNDRLLTSASVSRNRSSNQLLDYGLPTFTGFPSVLTNFPATIQNTSIEFTLSFTAFKSAKFSWSTSGNITIPKNKLISFPNLESSTYTSSLVIGQPIDVIRLFNGSGLNSQDGRFYVIDKSGHVTNTPDLVNDLTQFFSRQPKFYGGIQNNLRFKSLELDFIFQFVSVLSPDLYYLGSYPGSRNYNQPISVLDRWQKPGDLTNIPPFTSNSNSKVVYSYYLLRNSTLGISNKASFIRLKNISLSYSIPKSALNRIKLENLRVFAQGQNLLTFTRFVGLDPENQSSSALPPLKMLTIGVQVGL